MDAGDFADHYLNLQIQADVPGAPFNASVSINKYLIATQGNINQIVSNQTTVIDKIRQSGSPVSGGLVARLKNGKASPEDFEWLLGSAVEAGALSADQQALQKWADANLGIDCTGFAIAYLVEIGALSWNGTLNGGAGCPWIYSQIAQPNWKLNQYGDQPEIWDTGAMQADDFILWMKSGGGPETKYPGHISVVVSVGDDGTLTCAESNGADDGDGHFGPKHTSRLLASTKSGAGKRWWDHGTGVIVVRPSGT